MTFDKRTVDKMLKANGYERVPSRGKGSHTIYRNRNNRTISVPMSCNAMVMKRLVKEYSLAI